ncbi:MAG TPA: hypothetical protein VFR81_04180 [Longimicrobium sp.]|nr:hypothetical protein [Longimicrobium sp.]
MTRGRRISLALLAAVFVAAGVLHFAITDAYVRIMPPYLPAHRELVLLSGACEIAGGLGLLWERTRRAAGIGLVLLLLAVWPANLQMALDARDAAKPIVEQALLWARLPLQPLLMIWIWRVSRPPSPSP